MLHAFAMGAPDVAPRQLQKAFDTVVRTRGGKPEDEGDAPGGGIAVDAGLQTFDGYGAWVLMETEHELPLSLAIELAAKVNKTITVHTITMREVSAKKAVEEGSGGTAQHRTVEVSPDGAITERDTIDPQAESEEDLHERSLSDLLTMMITGMEIESAGEPRRLPYILPSPRTSKLPPRLAELATLISDSGKFSVQAVGGQTMLRLTLPDGSRRFSRVTPEELEQLRETTGIEPS